MTEMSATDGINLQKKSIKINLPFLPLIRNICSDVTIFQE